MLDLKENIMKKNFLNFNSTSGPPPIKMFVTKPINQKYLQIKSVNKLGQFGVRAGLVQFYVCWRSNELGHDITTYRTPPTQPQYGKYSSDIGDHTLHFIPNKPPLKQSNNSITINLINLHKT